MSGLLSQIEELMRARESYVKAVKDIDAQLRGVADVLASIVPKKQAEKKVSQPKKEYRWTGEGSVREAEVLKALADGAEMRSGELAKKVGGATSAILVAMTKRGLLHRRIGSRRGEKGAPPVYYSLPRPEATNGDGPC